MTEAHPLTSWTKRNRVVWGPEVILIAGTTLIADLKAVAEGSPFRDTEGPIDWRDRYSGTDAENLVEFAGRTCYQSHGQGRDSESFHSNIQVVGHGSLWEHVSYTWLIRGVTRWLTHEFLRQRAGLSPSQASSRYFRFHRARMVVPADLVMPCWDLSDEDAQDVVFDLYEQYLRGMEDFERLSKKGLPAVAKKRINEIIRHALPSSAETELLVTMNLRGMLHFFRQRGSPHAASEIRQLAYKIFKTVVAYAPRILGGIAWEFDENGIPFTNNVPRVSP